MGTRGYKAWRHKGIYIVRFNRYDSYPSHLGLALLRLIPRRRDEFERWIVIQRALLDEELVSLKDTTKNDEAFLSEKMVSTSSHIFEWRAMLMFEMRKPTNDLMIEWYLRQSVQDAR